MEVAVRRPLNPAAVCLAAFSLAAMWLTGAAGTALAVQEDNLPVRGVIRPLNETTLSTDLVAPITRMPFREGQRFKAGDVLIEYNCERHKAERASALAEYRVQMINLENNQTLFKHRAAGQFELDTSKANTDKAKANVSVLDARIQQCTIKAPFDGLVAEQFVNPHEMPSAGAPVLKLVDDSRYEIELILPSRWLRWLKPGAQFQFSVEETGKTYPARIERLNATVDAVSQTIQVRGMFIDRPDDVRAGMSGSALFSSPQG